MMAGNPSQCFLRKLWCYVLRTDYGGGFGNRLDVIFIAFPINTSLKSNPHGARATRSSRSVATGCSTVAAALNLRLSEESVGSSDNFGRVG
jgi:hypothetical protein